MHPSWPGRLVILALPNSVSMIAPLVRMFRLTNWMLAVFSTTVLILTLVIFPFLSETFTSSAENKPVF